MTLAEDGLHVLGKLPHFVDCPAARRALHHVEDVRHDGVPFDLIQPPGGLKLGERVGHLVVR